MRLGKEKMKNIIRLRCVGKSVARKLVFPVGGFSPINHKCRRLFFSYKSKSLRSSSRRQRTGGRVSKSNVYGALVKDEIERSSSLLFFFFFAIVKNEIKLLSLLLFLVPLCFSGRFGLKFVTTVDPSTRPQVSKTIESESN